MAVVFEKTKYLTDKTMHYCPGCTHGISHRLVAEALEDLEKAGKMPEGAVGICPVGCSVFAYDYFNIDMQEASHGRAPAVATGTKLVRWRFGINRYGRNSTCSNEGNKYNGYIYK